MPRSNWVAAGLLRTLLPDKVLITADCWGSDWTMFLLRYTFILSTLPRIDWALFLISIWSEVALLKMLYLSSLMYCLKQIYYFLFTSHFQVLQTWRTPSSLRVAHWSIAVSLRQLIAGHYSSFIQDPSLQRHYWSLFVSHVSQHSLLFPLLKFLHAVCCYNRRPGISARSHRLHFYLCLEF
jgi:hypothetical protein